MGQNIGSQLPSGLLELAADPASACMAIDPSGGSTVPVPDEVAEMFSTADAETEPLDALDPASRSVAVSLFDVARRHGEARGEVRVLADPGRMYRLHMFNLCESHGCLVSVIVPAELSDSAPPRATSPLPTPRRLEASLSVTGVITEVDAAFTRALGWEPEEIVGRSALEFIDPEDQERSIAFWVDVLAEAGATRRLRQRWLRKDGSQVWMETTETNLLHDPERSCIAAELVDISDEMSALTSLREREELLARLTEALPTGVIQIDAGGQTVFSNQRWFDITGLEEDATFADFVALAQEHDRDRIREAIQLALSTKSDGQLEVALKTPGGAVRTCQLRTSSLTEGADRASVLVSLEDISESYELQRRLVEQAERDPLTDLLNRSAILERLDACVSRAQNEGHGVGVLYVDLDDFKSVNDRYGHGTGDELLRRVGDTIRNCVRADDLVGRLGGDEFVVIVPKLVNPSLATALAERLDFELSGIVVARGERLITGSVGVALFDGDSTSADDLLEAADQAMYEAKRKRYAERMSPGLEPRRELEWPTI